MIDREEARRCAVATVLDLPKIAENLARGKLGGMGALLGSAWKRYAQPMGHEISGCRALLEEELWSLVLAMRAP